MSKVYLLLGSNLGDSQQQLSEAKKYIEQQIGRVVLQSSLYLTEAWGNIQQPDYFNQVIVVETALRVEETLHIILSVEKNMGRIRTQKNAPRIIDIDILFFDHQIVNKRDLIIPHPQLQNRRFALQPLHEIASDFVHPVFQKTIQQLLNECPDSLNVKKFSS